MAERRDIISRKIQINRVKQMMSRMEGIEALEMDENGENILLAERYLSYTRAVYAQDGPSPCSRLPHRSSERRIVSWILENMCLDGSQTYFFLCYGIWVKIRFSDLWAGVKSLWEHYGPCVKGFLLSDAEVSRFMEVSADSRDEENYVMDIWNCEKEVPVMPDSRDFQNERKQGGK